MNHSQIQYLNWEGQSIALERKPIKHLYLRLSSRTGQVRVSAPEKLSLKQIHAFYLDKLPWLKKQQDRLQKLQTKQQQAAAQDRANQNARHETTIYLRGKAYVLEQRIAPGKACVKQTANKLIIQSARKITAAARQKMLKEFYKQEIKRDLENHIDTWQKIIGVQVQTYYVRQMKTKWGSCNPRRHTIRLNSELIHYPAICLEYVVVHELIHMLEASHNKRFYNLMDHFMPAWRTYRDMLKQTPARLNK